MNHPEDVLWFANVFFIRVIHKWGGRLGGLVLEFWPDKGAVLLEGFEVLGLIVSCMVLPHAPEDFEPALA